MKRWLGLYRFTRASHGKARAWFLIGVMSIQLTMMAVSLAPAQTTEEYGRRIRDIDNVMEQLSGIKQRLSVVEAVQRQHTNAPMHDETAALMGLFRERMAVNETQVATISWMLYSIGLGIIGLIIEAVSRHLIGKPDNAPR
jgi:uncharacterized protein YerC